MTWHELKRIELDWIESTCVELDRIGLGGLKWMYLNRHDLEVNRFDIELNDIEVDLNWFNCVDIELNWIGLTPFVLVCNWIQFYWIKSGMLGIEILYLNLKVSWISWFGLNCRELEDLNSLQWGCIDFTWLVLNRLDLEWVELIWMYWVGLAWVELSWIALTYMELNRLGRDMTWMTLNPNWRESVELTWLGLTWKRIQINLIAPNPIDLGWVWLNWTELNWVQLIWLELSWIESSLHRTEWCWTDL